MFIEFRPGIPKPAAETRSDLRIAVVAVAALALLIALLPEAGSHAERTPQAPLATSSTGAKSLPDR
jgi:hypothetical protein